VLDGMPMHGILDMVAMRTYLMRGKWAVAQRIDVVGSTFMITRELGLGRGCLYRSFRIVLSMKSYVPFGDINIIIAHLGPNLVYNKSYCEVNFI
jgi:hypothetical protein